MSSNFQKYYLEIQTVQQAKTDEETIRLALALPPKKKQELLAALLRDEKI